jgi:hypothetical protein
MTLATDIRLLIQELDRTHTNGSPNEHAFDTNVFSAFCTAESGQQITFTTRATDLVRSVSRTLYDNAPDLAQRVDFEAYYYIVRRSVADCFVTCQASTQTTHDDQNYVRVIRAGVDSAIEKLHTEYTHYFPAWTFGLEASQPFSVGGVNFQTREAWLDAISFPDDVTPPFKPNTKLEYDWKLRVHSALQQPAEGHTLNSLERDVFNFIRDCPSVLTVTVVGSELGLSKQHARFVCRTALDSLALLFNGGGQHAQIALHDEPLPPIHLIRMISTNGKLWLPSTSNKLRGWTADDHSRNTIPETEKVLLNAYSKIIDTLLKPTAHPAPNLANRWATALTWYGDGCRERSDAVALAKIACSLDILANGGKYREILNMLVNLTGIAPNSIVIRQTQTTMEKLVKRVYDEGRSRILHGTHVDPMMSFTDLRNHATTLAGWALRGCVTRWSHYTGADEDNTFRSIAAT